MKSKAETVAAYIRSNSNFQFVEPMESYHHMGATLADAVLQPGIDYDSVVQPRVQYILKTYPQAVTTSAFAQVVISDGATSVLRWQGRKKRLTSLKLLSLLLKNRIETEDDLKVWLEDAANVDQLKQVKGVKDKTANYLGILVGLQRVAIDTRLLKFAVEAGVSVRDNAECPRHPLRDSCHSRGWKIKIGS